MNITNTKTIAIATTTTTEYHEHGEEWQKNDYKVQPSLFKYSTITVAAQPKPLGQTLCVNAQGLCVQLET
jgi:hypothetical protein